MKRNPWAPLVALAFTAGCGGGDAGEPAAGDTAATQTAAAPSPAASPPAAAVDSGSFSAQVTGTPSGSWRGTASFTPSFNTAGQPLIVISMVSPVGDGKNQITLFHVGPLPGPGEYVITGQERELRAEISWPGGGLPSSVSQPGRLTITASDSTSTPRRLAGNFQFTAADATGRPQATVSGEFSASCTMAYRSC